MDQKVPEPIDRRSRLDRTMDALHLALDALDDDAEGRAQLDDGKKAGVRDAIKYAHDHLLIHMDEKSKAENLVAGIITASVTGLAGLLVGHVLTKPNEPRSGRFRDMITRLPPEQKASGLTALKQVLAVVEQWVNEQEPSGESPTSVPLDSSCGTAGPADTVEGAMWEPCQSPVEFVVEVPKFGNRGHVQRVCCAKHKDYVVGGAADAKVTRIAPPAPPPQPPEETH